MNKSAYLSGAGVVACIAIAVATQSQSSAAAAPAASQPNARITSLPSAVGRFMEHITRVAPHVYMINAPLSSGPSPLANEMVIEQSDGLVLIDAGKTRGAGKRIVALIRSISRKPVKAVIITHWHQDHVLGLGPIVEAWPGAKIIASRDTIESINTDVSYKGVPRAGEDTVPRAQARAKGFRDYADQLAANLTDMTLPLSVRRGWADVIGVLDQRAADEQGTYLVVPTISFEKSYRIPDSVAPVEARFFGGAHTAGDIVAWAPRQRVVATGDIVTVPILYPGKCVLQWPITLRSIKALQPLVIVPGHGPALKGTAFLDRMISAFAGFRTTAERFATGPALPDEEVQKRIDVSREEAMIAGNDPWQKLWFAQYFAANAFETYRELKAQSAGTPSTPDAPSASRCAGGA